MSRKGLNPKLSPAMADAMAKLKEHGALVRWAGGWWSWAGCRVERKVPAGDKVFAVPGWSVTWVTVAALLERELVTVTHRGAMGFPSRVVAI